MAREKKPIHKVQMTEGKRNIIHQLLEEYDIQTAEDIQDALKDLLGGTIKEMMEAEMDEHLGYEKSERSDNDDYRNGYKPKRVNSSYGTMEIEVLQERKSTCQSDNSKVSLSNSSIGINRSFDPADFIWRICRRKHRTSLIVRNNSRKIHFYDAFFSKVI